MPAGQRVVPHRAIEKTDPARAGSVSLYISARPGALLATIEIFPIDNWSCVYSVSFFRFGISIWIRQGYTQERPTVSSYIYYLVSNLPLLVLLHYDLTRVLKSTKYIQAVHSAWTTNQSYKEYLLSLAIFVPATGSGPRYSGTNRLVALFVPSDTTKIPCRELLSVSGFF